MVRIVLRQALLSACRFNQRDSSVHMQSAQAVEKPRSADAGMQEVPCRVCGSERSRFICRTPNEHSRTALLEHFRCLDCGSVFVGNLITPAELGEAYGSLDNGRYYREIEEQSDRKMQATVRDIAAFLPRSAALLDIGTGNGRFVEHAHAAGFTNVSAHEIAGSDLSRIHGIARAIYQDFDYVTIPSDSFDCVTLLDVAEHVPEPAVLFRNCRRILKQGGILYFHTPVVTRLDRLMHRMQGVPGAARVGRVWLRGRTSVFHLQNYTRASIEIALRRVGFEDIRTEIVNELSWPVSRYVQTYLLEKQGLPPGLAPFLTPAVYPLIATRLFNANKAVVTAR
jgi:SAM-dependent methyltransferase